MEKRIIEDGFNLLNQVKLFHWATKSYSCHVALGELYDTVSELHDKLIECYLGSLKKSVPLFEVSTSAISDVSNIVEFLKIHTVNFRKIRVEIKSSELQNIVDEIISQIDKTCYLLSLS